MKKPSRKSAVSLPLNDFGCALDLCDKFNLSSAARPGQRVQVVLSQALREMQPLAGAIKAGGRAEAAYHGGPTYLLTRERGWEEAQRQDQMARHIGKATIALSEVGKHNLCEIKAIFGLSSDANAASLAVRVYNHMLDNLWRGNHLHLWDKDEKEIPYDTAKLKAIAARPWQTSRFKQ